MTASITGRITTGGGAPIRRAEVRLVGQRNLSRFATTDENGQYQLRNLPAGEVMLHVSRTGFVPLEFGQRRPSQRRTPITLSIGQRFVANVSLPRAGAITGRIVDTVGEPVLGARVQAMRRRLINGQRGLQPVGQIDTTDDTGAYRVYGLMPGEYYLAVQESRAELPANVPLTGTSLFYPGTIDRRNAQSIFVDVGVEARADMQIVPVRAARISGTVLTPDGQPAAGARVSLFPRDVDFAGGLGGMLASTMVPADANGNFVMSGVPPGVFTLRAEHTHSTPQMLSQRFADFTAVMASMDAGEVPIVVEGDLTDVTIAMTPPGTVGVTVRADRGVTTALPAGLQISVRVADRGDMATLVTDRGSNLKVSMFWSGPGRVNVNGLPSNWTVKAILFDGEDVTDRPIEPQAGTNGLVEVVLTDRLTEVTGTVASTSFSSEPVQAEVLVFPADPETWTYPSRYVRTTRTGDRGTFSITKLPPRDDYRIVALDYLDDGEEFDTELLKQFRDRGARFSIKEGEQSTVELKVVQR